jgi:hypothetical protein
VLHYLDDGICDDLSLNQLEINDDLPSSLGERYLEENK